LAYIGWVSQAGNREGVSPRLAIQWVSAVTSSPYPWAWSEPGSSIGSGSVSRHQPAARPMPSGSSRNLQRPDRSSSDVTLSPPFEGDDLGGRGEAVRSVQHVEPQVSRPEAVQLDVLGVEVALP